MPAAAEARRQERLAEKRAGRAQQKRKPTGRIGPGAVPGVPAPIAPPVTGGPVTAPTPPTSTPTPTPIMPSPPLRAPMPTPIDAGGYQRFPLRDAGLTPPWMRDGGMQTGFWSPEDQARMDQYRGTSQPLGSETVYPAGGRIGSGLGLNTGVTGGMDIYGANMPRKPLMSGEGNIAPTPPPPTYNRRLFE